MHIAKDNSLPRIQFRCTKKAIQWLTPTLSIFIVKATHIHLVIGNASNHLDEAGKCLY